MANYPLTVFHFSVSWGADNIGFSEVSGLSQEIQAIEYRDGLMTPTTLPLKRPGLKKSGNITLKRGMVTGKMISTTGSTIRARPMLKGAISPSHC